MSGKEKIAENTQRAKSELEQALNELVKMPAFDPGEISYSAHALNNYLMVTGCTAELLIHIQDEGPGLSQEDQSKLYQRGVQLSAQPTGEEPTSGYGLAVAKDLIDKLSGDLWCESVLGSGACFSFRIPVCQDKK